MNSCSPVKCLLTATPSQNMQLDKSGWKITPSRYKMKIIKMWKGHQRIAILKCKMCNGWRNVRPSITWKLRRKASSCPSRNNAMVAMKSSHKSTQQGIVQEEETVRFVWQNIKLVYMDARSEGRMTVKMMMIQENTWVIPRQNDEPYAIRTALGWCVFGPIKA